MLKKSWKLFFVFVPHFLNIPAYNYELFLDEYLKWLFFCLLDVIGVCKSAEDVSLVTTKTSREVSKRALNLIDMTGKEVTATLWGEEVRTVIWLSDSSSEWICVLTWTQSELTEINCVFWKVCVRARLWSVNVHTYRARWLGLFFGRGGAVKFGSFKSLLWPSTLHRTQTWDWGLNNSSECYSSLSCELILPLCHSLKMTFKLTCKLSNY